MKVEGGAVASQVTKGAPRACGVGPGLTIARYGRVDLLCIDELGYMELDRRGAELLFQVLTEREEKNSVAIASNESFGGWTKTFTDPRLCAAIVDRLTFNGTIIETGTDSYRLASTRARAEAVRLRLPAPAPHPARQRQQQPDHGPLRVRRVPGVPQNTFRVTGRIPEPVRYTITPQCSRGELRRRDLVQLRQQGLLDLGRFRNPEMPRGPAVKPAAARDHPIETAVRRPPLKAGRRWLLTRPIHTA